MPEVNNRRLHDLNVTGMVAGPTPGTERRRVRRRLPLKRKGLPVRNWKGLDFRLLRPRVTTDERRRLRRRAMGNI